MQVEKLWSHSLYILNNIFLAKNRNVQVRYLFIVFINSEVNNKWGVNYLQNDFFRVQNTYSNEFSIGLSTLESLFLIWYEAVNR